MLAMALVALAMATAQEAQRMFDKSKFWMGNMVNKADEANKMAVEVQQMAHADQLEMAGEALAKACVALAIMKALDALAKATSALEKVDSKKLEKIFNDERKKATMAREMAEEAKKMANELLQVAHGDQQEMASEALAKARMALSMACISQAMMIAFDALTKAPGILKWARDEKKTKVLKAKQMANDVLDKLEMARDHQMKVRKEEDLAQKNLEEAEYNKAHEASNMARDMLLGMSYEVVSNAREALGIISPYQASGLGDH